MTVLTTHYANGLSVGDVLFMFDGHFYVVQEVQTATTVTVRRCHWYERLWWALRALFKGWL